MHAVGKKALCSRYVIDLRVGWFIRNVSWRTVSYLFALHGTLGNASNVSQLTKLSRKVQSLTVTGFKINT